MHNFISRIFKHFSTTKEHDINNNLLSSLPVLNYIAITSKTNLESRNELKLKSKS